jgi:hypothetical protein
VAIIIATILKGILGALLVVPLLASVVVIGGYIQRRVLGLPPFDDDGNQQFTVPVESQAPRRRWTRKERLERLAKLPESDSAEQDLILVNDPPPSSEESPVEEKPQE